MRALLGRAFLAYSQGDLERSESYAAESLHTYRDLGKPVGIVFSMLCLALVAEDQDRDDDAIELLIQALDLFRQESHEFFTAHVLMTIGRLAYKQDDRQRAATCYEEALFITTTQQRLGNSMTMALTLNALAEVASDAGELELALSRYLESLQLWRELDHPWGTAEALAGIATIAAHLGILIIAASLCGAVDTLCDSVDATLTPLARREYARTMVTVRVGLGSRAALAVRDAGKKLSWAQARQYIASVERGLSTVSVDELEFPDQAIHLTQREPQVLALLVRDQSNQTISDALFTSVPTVKVHVSHILEKFGVGSRSAAIAIALRNIAVQPGQEIH